MDKSKDFRLQEKMKKLSTEIVKKLWKSFGLGGIILENLKGLSSLHIFVSAKLFNNIKLLREDAGRD